MRRPPRVVDAITSSRDPRVRLSVATLLRVAAVCIVTCAAAWLVTQFNLRGRLLGGLSLIENGRTFLVAGLLSFLALVFWGWQQAPVIFQTVTQSRLTLVPLGLISLLLFTLDAPAYPLGSFASLVTACLMFVGVYLLGLYPSLESVVGVDDPVEDPTLDAFGRVALARQILGVITSQRVTTRIALTGDWGSGKTSCLNFIKHFALKAGDPVVVFNAWQFRDRDEAWTGFIAAVDRSVALWKGQAVGPLKWPALARPAIRLATWFAPKVHSIGSLFTELFASRLTDALKTTKERVTQVLADELDGRQLVVLIDDLDRAEPAVIYEILLAIKEILDVPSCVFICGYDAVAVHRILRTRYRVSSPDLFLEKIFQWSLPIPEPTTLFKERFVTSQLKQFSVVRQSSILPLMNLLPSNPRRLKRYFRQLSMVHALASRLEDTEVRWDFIYRAELLKSEFADQIEELVADESFIKWLGLVKFIEKDKLPEHKAVEWQTKLETLLPLELNRARFLALMTALSDVALGLSAEQIKSQLHVISHPEVLTWREYRLWHARFRRHSLDSAVRLLCAKTIPLERRREFVLALIRDRHSELDLEAGSKLRGEGEQHLALAVGLTLDAERLVERAELFEGEPPLFSPEVVDECLGRLGYWAHFKSAEYSELRARERRLVIRLAQQTSDHAAAMLNASADRFRDLGMTDADREFRATLTTAKEIWQKALAEELIAGFMRPETIEALWGGDQAFPEKELLFEPNGFFHSKEMHDRFRDLVARAAENDTIHANLIEYCRMLLYSAVQGNPAVDKENAIRLLRDDDFRELMWRGATSRRISRRQMGSFLRDRNRAREVLGRADVMATPLWVFEFEPDLVTAWEPQPGGAAPATADGPGEDGIV